VIGWTFDIDSVTLDASFPTWDGGILPGGAQWELSNGTIVPVTLANVRTQAFQYNRRMFRSPYGTVWHQEGDLKRGVESITVSVHVLDDANGISDAAIAAEALASVAPDVVRVECHFGEFDVVALQSYSRAPVQSGYRLEFVFGSFDGLQV